MFKMPEAEIVLFAAQDIVTTSTTPNVPGGSGNQTPLPDDEL